MEQLAYVVVGGSIASLLLLLVGVVVCVAIAVFILRQLAAPSIAYTILYVCVGIIALLIAISFFFGGDGTVVTRP
jgi:hypothetical protein